MSRFGLGFVGSGADTDPFFSNVVLLMEFDGDYTDNSQNASSCTPNGSVAIDTSVKAGGSAALSLQRVSANDYVQVPYDADFAFGGDFTIEFFARRNGAQGTGYAGAFTTANGGNGYKCFWNNSAPNRMYFECTPANIHLSDASDTSDLTWYHYAVVRSGSTVTLYRDGTAQQSNTSSATVSYQGSNGMQIGRVDYGTSTTAKQMKGWLDGLRITKGVARYISAFSPPVLPYPHR